MQALFEYEAHPRKPADIFHYRMDDFGSKITDRNFPSQIFFGVLDNIDKIQKVIHKYAPEWPVAKIDPVERAILYIGIYELQFMKEAPAAVIINEAIELAKKFGDENSSKFINGVLNAVAKSKKPKKKFTDY